MGLVLFARIANLGRIARMVHLVHLANLARIAPFRAVVAAMLSLYTVTANAELAVVGTRHIYPVEQKSLTIQTRNTGDRPILVQVWLDEGDRDADPSLLPVPFIVTPPVYRMAPNERVQVALRHTGEAMPKDRESLYWINFLNIPARESDAGNVLKLSHRYRMKVLVRPPGLPGTAREAIDGLTWSVRSASGKGQDASSLEVWNPSAYFVSLAWIEIKTADGPVKLEGVTIAPLGVTRVLLPVQAAPQLGHGAVRFEGATDDGELVMGTATLAESAME